MDISTIEVMAVKVQDEQATAQQTQQFAGWVLQLVEKVKRSPALLLPESWKARWPAHVWAGCTAEDQKRLDERINHLLDAPASIHFVSCEPLLEAIELSGWLEGCPSVGWVIVGGESGHKARPFYLNWARSIVAQCREAGAAVFVKQLGAEPWLKGERGDLVHVRPKERAGGDPREWPLDLRVRQFPGAL